MSSISLECFSAAMVMSKVKSLKPKSLILTSGTLPPLDHLETDFGIAFPVKLQNPHIFKKERVLTRIVDKVKDEQLYLNSQNRQN
jgi:hypothetical protein